ncbi:MAG: diguanylate cyclase [Burkholderiales bacterium RIFCSPLOWO2_12_FULL_61_40]|nr:MAG: diguanylate cyclase [Burkholderiales bacterium RIFCSPLOWO2_12_FULL_61_40]
MTPHPVPTASALLAEDQRLRDLVDSTDGIIWEADALTFTNTFISKSAERLLGYTVQEWMEPDFWKNHIYPPDREQAIAYATAQTARLQNHAFEYRFMAKDGRLVWLHDSTKVVIENGKPRWLRGFLLDITQHKLAEQQRIEGQAALREAALHTQTILDHMVDGVITIDAKGRMESFNKAASRMFGYAPEEVLGRNVNMLMPEPHHSQHDGYLQHYHMTGEARVMGAPREVEGRRRDGSLFPMSLSISKIARGGQPIFIGLVRDVTERRQYEDEIRRLAFYDPLTGLANRRLLMDRLKHAIVTSDRSGQHGALMFLDLDHFKLLNDSLGHDVGDLLLQQVAARLQSCVREVDSVARLGGDEFVVLLEGLSPFPHEAAAQSEVIALKILDALGQAYTLRQHNHSSTPSIGIVLFMHGHETMDDVLKKADVAMYQAKAAGRNTVRFFDPAMQATASAHAELAKDMRHGLVKDEFVLHYQIQVQINEHGATVPTGAEALVRWNHPTRGLVPPAEFIPLAEETHIILPLGQWVLEAACAQLVAWSQVPATAQWTMAVNVSASQFSQPDFVAHVANALRKTGANAHLLKLEITESMLMDDVEDIIDKMGAIKAHGVRMSLDDFGTGYSSLSCLKRLPLDQLKIDQSFVRDLLTDPNDAIIARTVVALGHSLGLKVIAEGVESAEQRDMLAGMGCDAFQGYYFGRPMPASELARFC